MTKFAVRLSLPKILFSALLGLGVFLIVLSLIYNVTLAFFGGFVLVFWGSLMAFISGERLIKKDVLDATNLTYLSSFGKAVNNVCLQKMVYVPTKRRAPNTTHPFSQTYQDAKSAFDNTEIVNLAPENELFHLLERTYCKRFFGMGFSEFEAALPKLLVESLEIAETVQVQANEDVVRVVVEKPFDWKIYLNAKNQSSLIDAFGFPLSGAIAHVLANSLGAPVMITRHLVSLDRKTVQFEYTLIGKRSVPCTV